MRPICVPCQRYFRAEKNGFVVAEMIPVDEGRVLWSGYAIWAADMWRCEGCGAEILSGFGQQPISRHFDDDFVEQMGRVEGHVYG